VSNYIAFIGKHFAVLFALSTALCIISIILDINFHYKEIAQQFRTAAQ
jgi:hypothetical protein